VPLGEVAKITTARRADLDLTENGPWPTTSTSTPHRDPPGGYSRMRSAPCSQHPQFSPR